MFKLPAPALSTLAHEWFPFGVHLIEGIFQTVRRLEALNREQEKFVALGRIPPGSPTSSTIPLRPRRARSSRSTTTATTCSSRSTKLATHELTAAEFIALDAMRRDLEDVLPSTPRPARPRRS